ncbi:MAG TPA: polyketide synthase, partial [Myxococcota bacterium]|nr:polyketide synthase [Myxococcota bacterium]
MDFAKRLENLTAQQRQQLLAQLRQMVGKSAAQPEPIAVVGIGCRFPGGANTPDAYWQMLRRGGDGMAEVPRERWDIDTHFDPNPDAPGKVYTRWFGMLKERIDEFDAEFFDIPGREARGMDPQQRLLMEVAWEALENAAISPERLFGTDTGVFMGLSTIEFHPQQFAPGREAELDVYSNTGVNFSVAAGRLSYFLGMHGPAMAVDTACSSSLTA